MDDMLFIILLSFGTCTSLGSSWVRELRRDKAAGQGPHICSAFGSPCQSLLGCPSLLQLPALGSLYKQERKSILKLFHGLKNNLLILLSFAEYPSHSLVDLLLAVVINIHEKFISTVCEGKNPKGKEFICCRATLYKHPISQKDFGRASKVIWLCICVNYCLSKMIAASTGG